MVNTLTAVASTTYATKTKTQTVWLIHNTIQQFNKRLTFSIIGLSFQPRTVDSLVASLASLAHNSYNDKTKRKSSFFSFIFPTIEKIKNKTY
jgi:hypothetical protein